MARYITLSYNGLWLVNVTGTLSCQCDRHVEFHNEQRSHGGFANQGLPPLAVWQLHQKTPGDHLEKLIKLGLLKLDQEWSVRLMGSNMSMEQQQDKIGDVVSSDGPDDRPEKHEIPFALALEKKSQRSFQPDLREPTDGGGANFQDPPPASCWPSRSVAIPPPRGGRRLRPLPTPAVGARAILLRVARGPPRPPKRRLGSRCGLG